MIDHTESRVVSTEEARSHFAAMNPPVPYFETSALTGKGVNELFEAVLGMLSRENSVRELIEDSKQSYPETVENESPSQGPPKTEDRCIIC